MVKIWVRSKFQLADTPTILCLQPGLIPAYKLHGNEILGYFKGHPAASIQILDPAGETETEIVPMPGVRIIGWRCSSLSKILRTLGLRECSILLREISTIARLLRHVSTHGIHCIRSMQHEFSALRGGLVSEALNIPHVVEIAGNYEMLRRIWGRTIYFSWFGRIPFLRWPARKLNDTLLGWPLKRAYCVIGRNKNNYEHAFALGTPVENLTLIRIHLAKSFADEGACPPPLPTRYMLFVARMTAEKFPHDVVAVYQKLAARYQDLALVMIGDGDHLPGIRSQVQATSCSDRIYILGTKPYEEVIRWTRGATIAFETYSGSALAEKLICSVPVVAYDVEWMSEIIIDNFSGELARFRDIEAAFQACCRLLDNPDKAKSTAQMGKRLALAMFDRQTIERKEESIFGAALTYAIQLHRKAN